MSHLIQQATAAIASQIEHTTLNPLPATTLDVPSTREIQLSTAVIPSQPVNTSDNLSSASTLDMPPPLRSTATATQVIQPTYYTTPPLQNLPVTAHDQQFSPAQQIPAWPTTYLHPKFYSTIASSCQLPTEFFIAIGSCWKPNSECSISVHPTQPITELYITTDTCIAAAADTAR